jgi:hypothetical protein
MGELLLVGLASGAVGGLLGWFLHRLRKVPKGTKPDVRIVVAVVVVTAGVPTALRPVLEVRRERREVEAVGMQLYGNPRLATLHANVLMPILRNEAMRARILAASAAGQPGVESMVHAGVARLQAAELGALFDVKRAMAEARADVCAGFWTGGLPSQVVISALRGLGEEQQRAWITLSARALSLELKASAPPPHVSGAARTAAFAVVAAALPPAAAASYARGASGEPLTPAEACAAFRALVDGIALVPATARETAMRAVMNPEIVDP